MNDDHLGTRVKILKKLSLILGTTVLFLVITPILTRAVVFESSLSAPDRALECNSSGEIFLDSALTYAIPGNAHIFRGDTVFLLERTQGAVRIQTLDGRLGWVVDLWVDEAGGTPSANTPAWLLPVVRWEIELNAGRGYWPPLLAICMYFFLPLGVGSVLSVACHYVLRRIAGLPDLIVGISTVVVSVLIFSFLRSVLAEFPPSCQSVPGSLIALCTFSWTIAIGLRRSSS